MIRTALIDSCAFVHEQAGRKTPTAISLHKELNAIKSSQFPWMYEVSKCAPQEALRDLEKAFKAFFGV